MCEHSEIKLKKRKWKKKTLKNWIEYLTNNIEISENLLMKPKMKLKTWKMRHHQITSTKDITMKRWLYLVFSETNHSVLCIMIFYNQP